MNRLRSLNDLQTLREKLLLEEKRPTIRVCCGTGCCAAGGLETAEAFSKEVKKEKSDIEVVRTGCQGWCEKGPLVAIEPQHLFYQRVTDFDVPKIMDLTVSRGRPIDRFLYTIPLAGRAFPGGTRYLFIRSRCVSSCVIAGMSVPIVSMTLLRPGGMKP